MTRLSVVNAIQMNAIYGRIVKAITSHFPTIQAVYLFGAWGDGKRKIGEVVNVALLLPEETFRNVEAYNFIAFQLSEELCTISGAEIVDIVNLRKANKALSAEIISGDRKILEADKKATKVYETDEHNLIKMFKKGGTTPIGSDMKRRANDIRKSVELATRQGSTHASFPGSAAEASQCLHKAFAACLEAAKHIVKIKGLETSYDEPDLLKMLFKSKIISAKIFEDMTHISTMGDKTILGNYGCILGFANAIEKIE